jgi:hypothetical protein
MPFLNRTFGVLMLTGGLFVVLWSGSSAEPPASDSAPARPRQLGLPEGTEIPEAPQIDSGEPPSNFFEEQVKNAFKRAAQGDFEQGGTGIAIADDILKVIEEVGPISARFASEASLEAPVASRAGFVADGGTARRARAAEQMLRAARLLEQLGGKGSDRVALIRQMREEAKRLLSE